MTQTLPKTIPVTAPKPIRLLMCWHSISGYMAACWRELASRPEVHLSVLAGTDNPGYKSNIVEGLNVTIIDEKNFYKPDVMAALVQERQPDVMQIPGWFLKGLTALPFRADMSNVRFVMSMDTQKKNTYRQKVGGIINRKYFSRMRRIFVPGERSFQLARDLGFEESQIVRGILAVDFKNFEGISAQRLALPGGWPKKWLYIGRYIPVKALDVLIPSYRAYRSRVSDPWPLTTMGAGDLQHLLKGVEGVTDIGFVQPADQPKVLLEHGALLLPSRADAWGQVLAEAGASGMPLICTHACGGSVELVRSYYSGVVCQTESVEALTQAMVWMHERYDMLPEMGRRSRELAAAYGVEGWADKWVMTCQQLMNEKPLPA